MFKHENMPKSRIKYYIWCINAQILTCGNIVYVLEMDIKGDLLVFDATTIHSAGSWRLWFCCGSAPPLLMTLNTTRCLYGPISRRVKLMGSNWVGLDRNRTSSAGLESSLRKQQNHLWPYHRFLHITSNLADHWLVQRCERSEAKVALGFNRKGWKGEERETAQNWWTKAESQTDQIRKIHRRGSAGDLKCDGGPIWKCSIWIGKRSLSSVGNNDHNSRELDPKVWIYLSTSAHTHWNSGLLMNIQAEILSSVLTRSFCLSDWLTALSHSIDTHPAQLQLFLLLLTTLRFI